MLILISDLFEGSNALKMIKRAASLVAAGIEVVAVLALSDAGKRGRSPKLYGAPIAGNSESCVHA